VVTYIDPHRPDHTSAYFSPQVETLLGYSPDELTTDTPLWYYILREAEVRQGGQHLGEVGGRIVAEVLIGLLAGDPSSYLNMQPTWKPDGGIPAFQPAKFTLGDLLKFATR